MTAAASTGPRPLHSAAQAVEHALALVGHGVYQLGTGDVDSTIDGPRDCFGFAYCECYGVRRHRQGFNRGPWASVEDDLNVNSAIEDADHARELFDRVVAGPPHLGDLLAYPTFSLPVGGQRKTWIGHIAIVTGVSRLLEWDWTRPTWGELDVVQCRGPNGARPGIVATTAAHWDGHDLTWPKPEHRSVLLRVVP
ncbi:MAG: hypothetical protein V4479_07625 [Actinomycetota bacterium]